MRIRFGTQELDAMAINCAPSQLKEGDILAMGQSLFEIETIQKDLPAWDGPNHFTMFILRDDVGNEVSTRHLSGTQTAYRRRY